MRRPRGLVLACMLGPVRMWELALEEADKRTYAPPS